MKCEFCKDEHDSSYGTGRFCNIFCAKKFSSNKNRKETNKKISQALKGHKCIKGGTIRLCDYGCENKAKFELKNKKQCCEDSFNKCPKIRDKNSKGLSKAYKIKKRSSTPSHLWGKHWRHNKNSKGFNEWKKKLKTIVFIKNSIYRVNKEHLIEVFEWKFECKNCKISSWDSKDIILHIDHINGDNRDNRFENLRFLCPNCHSQTETYSGKKKVSDEIMIKALKESINIHNALLKCGLVAKGGNYQRAYKLIHEYKIKMVRVCGETGYMRQA